MVHLVQLWYSRGLANAREHVRTRLARRVLLTALGWQMNKTALHWLLVAITGTATACVATPIDNGADQSELGIGDDGPPDPPDPPVCVTNTCTKTYDGGYVTTLQQQLGCSQTYRYKTNKSAGFLGGLGSFCPTTAINILRTYHYHGFAAGYCDHCITVPTNKVFVFWTEWYGPGCPGGCEPGPSPGPI